MKITPEQLEIGSTQKRTRSEKREVFLRRITHVSLVGKDIEMMVRELLYLYDNRITEISGLECCRNLSRLYLQDNLIEKISGLDVGLDQLTILHLHNNRIHHVSGLQGLPALEHLKLDRQRLGDGQALSFDQDCMTTIAPTLKHLTVAGNRIADVTAFEPLTQLEVLDLSENQLDDVQHLSSLLSTYPRLQCLDTSLNPLGGLAPAKLRQSVILASSSLETFNDKRIPEVERKFVENLQRVVTTQQQRRKSSIASSTDGKIHPNLLSKQSSSTTAGWEDCALQAPNAAHEKPIPHLPPYATQYRDLILSQLPAAAPASQSRFRVGSAGNSATATAAESST
ncbi:Leucine-rich repeat-containing protein 43 [Geranomyces michiganensis]|nr:Leucine-rich repeat-containing protein 43 [Geranomyces michiganensis]